MVLICENFKKSPRSFIVQSLLATAAMAVILCFLQFLMHTAIAASLGASTFTIFALPRTETATPRRMVGGYSVGIICGIICSLIFGGVPAADYSSMLDFVPLIGGAIAVGLALFMMTVLNTEHPPAAGVALSFAVSGWAWETIGFILLFSISLAVARKLLFKHMINLF